MLLPCLLTCVPSPCLPSLPFLPLTVDGGRQFSLDPVAFPAGGMQVSHISQRDSMQSRMCLRFACIHGGWPAGWLAGWLAVWLVR